jgi:hypothetical protein
MTPEKILLSVYQLFSGVAVVSEHAVLQISHKVTAGDEIERM